MEYATLLRIEKKIDTLQACVDTLNYAMQEAERKAGIERWKQEAAAAATTGLKQGLFGKNG